MSSRIVTAGVGRLGSNRKSLPSNRPYTTYAVAKIAAEPRTTANKDIVEPHVDDIHHDTRNVGEETGMAQQ
jgi:hypothetical protein